MIKYNFQSRDAIYEKLKTLFRNERLILFTILIALILRIIYFVQNRNNPLLYYPILDESYYIDMGKAIALGDWAGEKMNFQKSLNISMMLV